MSAESKDMMAMANSKILMAMMANSKILMAMMSN
jgi:hypothetical protein